MLRGSPENTVRPGYIWIKLLNCLVRGYLERTRTIRLLIVCIASESTNPSAWFVFIPPPHGHQSRQDGYLQAKIIERQQQNWDRG